MPRGASTATTSRPKAPGPRGGSVWTSGPAGAFGPVELPVLGVTLDLEGASEADRAAFVRRFLLGFQRAGG